ncbi:MAG: hypothetical protein ABII00_17850, partial [Elusimicrobiota bacterium]
LRGRRRSCAPGPGRSRLWLWAAGAAAAIAAAAAAAMFWGSSRIGRDYAVPFSHPTALVWQEDRLWAADWQQQAVFRMRLTPRGLSVEKRYSMPESHITGMALDGESVYVADSWRGQIQRWNFRADRTTLDRSWPSPGERPSALFFDGEHLWSADMAEQRVYQHAVDDDLTVLRSFPVGHGPVGLFADEQKFWSADMENRLVYRHRWDLSLSLVEAYRLSGLDDGKAPLSSFTMRGRRVWLGRDGLDRLIERPLWRFQHLPPPAAGAAAEPGPAAGIPDSETSSETSSIDTPPGND